MAVKSARIAAPNLWFSLSEKPILREKEAGLREINREGGEAQFVASSLGESASAHQLMSTGEYIRECHIKMLIECLLW